MSELSGEQADTDHYLVVAEVRETLAKSKQTMNKFHMERLNLKKLNKVESKEHYQVEISEVYSFGKRG
jgi:hypothetical protein